MPDGRMSDERLAKFCDHRDHGHGMSEWSRELLDALVAERAALAQRTQEWEDERKFLEQIEEWLGADCHGSVGSGIEEAIDKLRAEVKRLEERLRQKSRSERHFELEKQMAEVRKQISECEAAAPGKIRL